MSGSEIRVGPETDDPESGLPNRDCGTGGAPRGMEDRVRRIGTDGFLRAKEGTKKISPPSP